MEKTSTLQKIEEHTNKASKHFNMKNKDQNNSEITTARKEIDIAVKLFEVSYEKDPGPLELLEVSTTKANNESTGNIGMSLFGFAGKIYAHIDKEKSLEYFKKYQYYSFKNSMLSNTNSLNDKIEKGVIAYKFRACSPFLFSDLAQKKITVSKPNCMNDPMDSLYNIWSTPEHLNLFVNDKMHIPIFHKSFDYYRFCSFCIDDNARNTILRNILMWSHYADEHKGICIQYKLKNNAINTKMGFDAHHQVLLQRINYSKKKKNISINDSHINLSLAFINKAYCWKYEKEARLICYDDNTEEDHLAIEYNQDISIEAIYFGIKCTDENKTIIKKLLSDQDIKYYDMTFNYNNIYNIQINKE